MTSRVAAPWWAHASYLLVTSVVLGCARGPAPRAGNAAAPKSAPATSTSAGSPAGAAPPASASPAPAGSASAAPTTTGDEAPGMPTSGPLPPRWREALASIEQDPAPEKITLGRHYVVSNEAKPQLWKELVQGKGGIVMGVGTEQNLLIAAWARADLLVLMDFDQWVVDINRVHGVIIDHASTPEEYVRLWGPAATGQVKQWVKEAYPDQHARVLKPYRIGRNTVHRRLYMLRRLFKGRQLPSYLSDQKLYDHVRRLVREGRYLAVRGDLTAKQAVRSIAAFARKAELPVRVVYLSHARDYFPYSQGGYRSNMLALPFDEHTVVLHTKPIDGRRYNYVAQPGLAFQRWLKHGTVKSFGELFRHATRVPGKEPVYRLEALPPDADDAAPEAD